MLHLVLQDAVICSKLELAYMPQYFMIIHVQDISSESVNLYVPCAVYLVSMCIAVM